MAAIGLFGLGEVLAGAEAPKGHAIPNVRYGLCQLLPDAKDWVRSRWAIARGTMQRAHRDDPGTRSRSRGTGHPFAGCGNAACASASP